MLMMGKHSPHSIPDDRGLASRSPAKKGHRAPGIGFFG